MRGAVCEARGRATPYVAAGCCHKPGGSNAARPGSAIVAKMCRASSWLGNWMVPDIHALI
jgi:hypothetical protein